MPHTVRSHQRQTASGRTTTVRQHTRRGGSAKAARPPRRTLGERVRNLFGRGRPGREREDFGWADDEPQQSPKERRRAAKTAERARQAAERDRWEHDMKFAAAKQGLPAYRPLGTTANAWKPRTPAERQKAAEKFGNMLDDMRDWRSRPEPEPGPAEPMTPQLAKALGCDTPEGREKYERGRAYREAGYDGPLDKDNRIPDPDDPANLKALNALAGLRNTGK